MKNNLFLLGILLLSIFTQSSQCEKEKVTTEKSNLSELSITLDQTAWFCAGDCRFNFVFQEGNVTTRRFDKPNDETPLWTCSRTLSSKNWQAIVNALDIDNLIDTEETIGCPGCADAPIETLRVENGDFSKEVRMNQGETVPSIQPLLDELREQAESFKSQKNCQ
jgi:hypothetical protein